MHRERPFYSHENGQILLIVVLSMVVVLTVGLSVASRTITNIKISKQNEESERAFQAAEAGVEQAINSIKQSTLDQSSVPVTFGNNSTALYSIQTTKGKQIILNGGENVEQDIGIDLWLSDHPSYTNSIANTTLTIYWSISGQNCSATSGDNVVAALEVVSLSGTIANPTYTKNVYDPCSRINGATNPAAGGTLLNTAFLYKAVIPITNGLIAKVIPLYNSSKVGIDSTSDLPSQGSQIDSTGKSGDTVRKVTFFSSYPQMPVEIFPYSLISQ